MKHRASLSNSVPADMVLNFLHLTPGPSHYLHHQASSSTDLLQVFSSWPTFLLPCGFHFKCLSSDVFQWLFEGVTYPGPFLLGYLGDSWVLAGSICHRLRCSCWWFSTIWSVCWWLSGVWWTSPCSPSMFLSHSSSSDLGSSPLHGRSEIPICVSVCHVTVNIVCLYTNWIYDI